MPSLHQVGKATAIESYAEDTPWGAVFEDDGDTGYFYGLDTRLGDESVLDALGIYNVEGVRDRSRPVEIDIVWSADGQRVALLINGYAHAAFDFVAQRGYCRTGFPATSRWSGHGHEWDDRAVDFLRSAT